MISDIGSTDNTALLCITNHPATESDGSNSGGDWFAPDGDKVGSLGHSAVRGFERNRAPMIVRLRRNSGTPEEGIYYCEVEDADNITQTVYVGLYNSGEGNGKANYLTGSNMQRTLFLYIVGIITIAGDVTLTVDSDLNGPSPQFTLTCISTGGPATTVTWTRDSVTVTEGTETVLDTHTLTVTGRLGGLYTCTVANEVSPQDSESFSVEGICSTTYTQLCSLSYFFLQLPQLPLT